MYKRLLSKNHGDVFWWIFLQKVARKNRQLAVYVGYLINAIVHAQV